MSLDNRIQINMDGKGRWMDDVGVERLWRTVKCEDINVRGNENPADLRAGLNRYFRFYNTQRSHAALDSQPQ